MPACEECQATIEPDSEFTCQRVLLGDGSEDDRFYYCEACSDEAQHKVYEDEDEYLKDTHDERTSNGSRNHQY